MLREAAVPATAARSMRQQPWGGVWMRLCHGAWESLHIREPAEIVEDLERESELPLGSEERFSGYGVMGLPFRSGHVLGLRRFPASSIGPGYRSVWHRDPDGRWTFYQDQPAELACTR